MQHLSVGRLPENELQRRFAIQKIAHMNQLIKEFERSVRQRYILARNHLQGR